MKKPVEHLIAEVPRRQSRSKLTIGIDLGDVWSHYCTLNEDGQVVDRGRFRTTPKAIDKWFTDVAPARVAMEAGTHSIWINEQLQELGYEVLEDAGILPEEINYVIDILRWFGVIGIYLDDEEERFSYQYEHNSNMLTAGISHYAYCIRPAFRVALGCTQDG